MTDNKNNLTPDEMSWEEFKAMAEREPNLKGNWIYRLEQRFVDSNIENPYPRFELDRTEKRLFTSFDEAVRFIQEHPDGDLYNSLLTQVPSGELEFETGASWLFGRDGMLIDYSTTRSYPLREAPEAFFYGRPDNRQRFRVGDIVESIGRNDEISLAVVCSLPPDPQWCWNLRNRSKDSLGYILDYSDDSGVIIDGPSFFCHYHQPTLCWMKPRFPIPEEIRNEMQTWLQRAREEEEQQKACMH